MRSRIFCASVLVTLGCGAEALPAPDLLVLDASDPASEVEELLAQSGYLVGDEEGDEAEGAPPAEPETDAEEKVQKVLDAKSADERVEVQDQIVEEQVEQADHLNEDLEEILAEIRRKKGLPPRPAYKAPSEEAAQIALDEHMEQREQMAAPREDETFLAREDGWEDDEDGEAAEEDHGDAEKGED